MSALTGETDVFSSSGTSVRCAVMFLARRHANWRAVFTEHDRANVMRELSGLAAADWRLSLRSMFDPTAKSAPAALDTGFAHDVDVAGVFEAPTISEALAGTVRLEAAGWERLFATDWLIGPREFATVTGAGELTARPWGFLALWEWNDAWARASRDERSAYDAECDVAFKNDLALEMNIAGRHRLDWAHSWHHLGAWEAPSLEAIDQAMAGHEAASDFMFTTSRHFVGRVRLLNDLIPFS